MDWEPHEFTKADLVFPTTIVGHMPAWKDLPHPFGHASDQDRHPAVKLATRMFYGPPIPKGVEFHAIEGIDPEKAFHHLRYLLGSWEPKQEHKLGGVGYLISLWYKKVIVPNEDGEDEVLWQ